MLNVIKGATVAAALLMAAPAFAQVYGPDYGYSYSYGPGPAYDPGYGPDYVPVAPAPAPGDYVEAAPAGPAIYEGRSVAVQPGAGMQDTTAWCESHYRSYDAQSGTYLGYDGVRHPCP